MELGEGNVGMDEAGMGEGEGNVGMDEASEGEGEGNVGMDEASAGEGEGNEVADEASAGEGNEVADEASAGEGNEVIDRHHHHSHHNEQGLYTKCDTPDLTPNDLALVQQTIDKWKDEQFVSNDGDILVPTYVHLIYPGDDPTVNQVFGNVLAKTSQFVLMDTTETSNMDWWNAAEDSDELKEMKTELREGGCNALNIYYNNYNNYNGGSGSTGFGTYPWRYATDPDVDGVVIRHTCTVGGTYSVCPYNEGDLLVHETVSFKFGYTCFCIIDYPLLISAHTHC